MQRAVVLFAGLLLLGYVSAVAQDADPFHEVTPRAAPAPGQDPFQMAPAEPAPAPKPPRPAPEPPDPDLILWQTIQASPNPSDFETYLRLFPNGRFADDAHAHLAALRAALPAGAVVAESGVLTPLRSHQNHNKRCASRPLPLTIIEQPQHGTATVREEAVKVPEKQTVGNSCPGALVNGKRIYYQSEPGFKGNDRLVYEYTLGDRVPRRETVNIIVH